MDVPGPEVNLSNADRAIGGFLFNRYLSDIPSSIPVFITYLHHYILNCRQLVDVSLKYV